MTSKQRAYLKSLAMKMDPIIQIGKSSLTPELTKAVEEALTARELIKISVLQNCLDDPRSLADMLAGRKLFFTEKEKKIRKKYFFPDFCREFQYRNFGCLPER